MNNLLIFVLFLLSPASVPCAQELVDIENSNFNKKVVLMELFIDQTIAEPGPVILLLNLFQTLIH